MILVGLGSNLGASTGIIQSAMQGLAVFADGEFRQSGLWRTSPVDCPPDSGDFINAVVSFEMRQEIDPQALLVNMKQLEREYGREGPTIKNAPRELDLDLLVYGDIQMQHEGLVLPHPRAKDRKFVLAPAAQVVPGLIWPGTDKTVLELLEALDSDEVVTLIGAC